MFRVAIAILVYLVVSAFSDTKAVNYALESSIYCTTTIETQQTTANAIIRPITCDENESRQNSNNFDREITLATKRKLLVETTRAFSKRQQVDLFRKADKQQSIETHNGTKGHLQRHPNV